MTPVSMFLVIIACIFFIAVLTIALDLIADYITEKENARMLKELEDRLGRKLL